MDYLHGLETLKARLADQAPPDFYTYEARLKAYLNDIKLHGSTETLRHERNEVIDALNGLARVHIGSSFTELCSAPSATASAVAQVTGPAIFSATPSSIVAPALNQLRDPVSTFTGREREVEQLVAMLDGSSARGARVVAIRGMPGVGKTELALVAAQHLRSLYPRQLFLELGGLSDERLSSVHVLGRALAAVAVASGGRACALLRGWLLCSRFAG